MTRSAISPLAPRVQVPKVLAAIFALWTVSFYKRTHDPNSSSDQISLRKPHAVQVLCILRKDTNQWALPGVDGQHIVSIHEAARQLPVEDLREDRGR